jgi:hypothetical protein
MDPEKYVGMDVHQGHNLGCRYRWQRQADHGVHSGDKAGHDSRVCSRVAGKMYRWPSKKQPLLLGYMIC